jgi:hypothetical protein
VQSASLPILFYRVTTIVAVPFLALFGLMFLCVRTVLAASMRLVGWQLAWPPILVDGEPPNSYPGKPTPYGTSSGRRAVRRT